LDVCWWIPGYSRRVWAKEAWNTVENAMVSYIVEVIPKFHFWKQQLISLRFSTALLLWQGKEVRYSQKSLTCALSRIWSTWPRRVFVYHMRKNVMHYQVTSQQSLRREEVGYWISCILKGEGSDRMTPGCGLWKSDVRLSSLPAWHRNNPQTRSTAKGRGTPPPDRLRHLTPELQPPLPRTPPVPPGNIQEAQCSQIDTVLPWFAYIHCPLPNPQYLNPDAYSKDRKHNNTFNPDLQTNEDTSTHYYTICSVPRKIKFILHNSCSLFSELDIAHEHWLKRLECMSVI